MKYWTKEEQMRYYGGYGPVATTYLDEAIKAYGEKMRNEGLDVQAKQIRNLQEKRDYGFRVRDEGIASRDKTIKKLQQRISELENNSPASNKTENLARIGQLFVEWLKPGDEYVIMDKALDGYYARVCSRPRFRIRIEGVNYNPKLGAAMVEFRKESKKRSGRWLKTSYSLPVERILRFRV